MAHAGSVSNVKRGQRRSLNNRADSLLPAHPSGEKEGHGAHETGMPTEIRRSSCTFQSRSPGAVTTDAQRNRETRERFKCGENKALWILIMAYVNQVFLCIFFDPVAYWLRCGRRIGIATPIWLVRPTASVRGALYEYRSPETRICTKFGASLLITSFQPVRACDPEILAMSQDGPRTPVAVTEETSWQ